MMQKNNNRSCISSSGISSDHWPRDFDFRAEVSEQQEIQFSSLQDYQHWQAQQQESRQQQSALKSTHSITSITSN